MGTFLGGCVINLLLAHIGSRIAKLGVCIGNSLVDLCTKQGGDWVWPSGYWSKSVSP